MANSIAHQAIAKEYFEKMGFDVWYKERPNHIKEIAYFSELRIKSKFKSSHSLKYNQDFFEHVLKDEKTYRDKLQIIQDLLKHKLAIMPPPKGY